MTALVNKPKPITTEYINHSSVLFHYVKSSHSEGTVQSQVDLWQNFHNKLTALRQHYSLSLSAEYSELIYCSWTVNALCMGVHIRCSYPERADALLNVKSRKFCHRLSAALSTRADVKSIMSLDLCNDFNIDSLSRFQVCRSFSPSTCRRSSSSQLSATSCVTGRENTSARTVSASVSVLTSSHNATVPPLTSRSWRTRSLAWQRLGKHLTTTMRTQVTLEQPFL